MTAAQWLSEYGYIAVFVGCILEGETLLLVAGYAARKGHLSLPAIMLVAAIAATLGDQIFFQIGKHFGRRLLAKFPKLAERAGKVDGLIRQYHGMVIVGVRFMYGLRIAGPIVIGMSDIPKWRLLGFNALGAALWAVAVAGAGYAFGATLDLLPHGPHAREEVAIALLLLILGAHFLWRRRRERQTASATPVA